MPKNIMEDEINGFLQVLKLESNYSVNTTTAYANDLKQFVYTIGVAISPKIIGF